MTSQYYQFFQQLLVGYNNAVIYYLIAVNALTFFFLALSFVELVRFRRARSLVDTHDLMDAGYTPSISIVSPAYNEEATIIEAVRALLALRYPRFEVIVVNDGSRDRTLDLLKTEFALRRLDYAYRPLIPTQEVLNVYHSQNCPNLTVVDKVNGGKADALNVGINIARHELFCAIDADSLLEEDALLKAVYPFVRWRGRVAVTSGIIRIVNGCAVDKGRVTRVETPTAPLALFQVIEYLRIFLVGRFAWNAINSVIIVSGAFGLFDRELVVEAGGYTTNTVGEDMELVVRLHRRMREQRSVRTVLFLPDPVCWTEAPQTLRVLSRQRDRWVRGLVETVWKHRRMFMNPRYGIIGMFAMPTMVLTELTSPFVELSGYLSIGLGYYLGLLQTDFLVLFLIIALLFGILQSVAGLLIEELLFHRYRRLRDIAKLMAAAVLESFGYRQFNFAVRLLAFFNLLRGKKSWGRMTRVGFGKRTGP